MTVERADVVAVGLTGGIGAGKTTALRYFAEAGALTLSADEVVHQLYLREDVRQALTERFGRELLGTGGAIDRRRLAEAVRRKPDRLALLEALIHPLVEAEIRRFIDEAPAGAVVVCEVPLLFETGMQHLFDLVVTVEAGPDTRRSRSRHDFDLELFGEFEDLQASSERRVADSRMVFFNDGDVEHLRDFVRKAHACARGVRSSGAAHGAVGRPGPDGSTGEER